MAPNPFRLFDSFIDSDGNTHTHKTTHDYPLQQHRFSIGTFIYGHRNDNQTDRMYGREYATPTARHIFILFISTSDNATERRRRRSLSTCYGMLACLCACAFLLNSKTIKRNERKTIGSPH